MCSHIHTYTHRELGRERERGRGKQTKKCLIQFSMSVLDSRRMLLLLSWKVHHQQEHQKQQQHLLQHLLIQSPVSLYQSWSTQRSVKQEKKWKDSSDNSCKFHSTDLKICKLLEMVLNWLLSAQNLPSVLALEQAIFPTNVKIMVKN